MLTLAQARSIVELLGVEPDRLSEVFQREAARSLDRHFAVKDETLSAGFERVVTYSRKWLRLADVFERLWEADHPEEVGAADGLTSESEQEAKPVKSPSKTAAAAFDESTNEEGNP
jgi:hypothetical protein